MNMEIEGLIAEARMHFQRVLQLFLSTPSHSIFILPSVSVPVNVGWKQYTPRLYVTAELHDMKSQGAWVPKELLKDEIPEAEPTFEYLLEWELSFHCVKSPSFGVVYFSSCPALPHTGGEKLYRELFVWSNFVIVIYRMIDLRPAIKNSGPEMAQVTCTYHVMARNNSHTQLQKKWRSTDIMFSWA